MATCKDCLHHEACMKFNKVRVEVLEKTASRGADELCDTFANKSRYIELPCKIGQDAWVIRGYKGIKQPQKSEISEMYFTQQMKLIIVVKYVGRGEYGKEVFLTKEEAEAAIAERSKE